MKPKYRIIDAVSTNEWSFLGPIGYWNFAVVLTGSPQPPQHGQQPHPRTWSASPALHHWHESAVALGPGVPQSLPPAVHALIQAQSPPGASLLPELCVAKKIIISLHKYKSYESAYEATVPR